MWVFGIVLLVIAAIMGFGYFKQKKRMNRFESVESATVEMLQSLAESMSSGVGAGWLDYATEVNGTVRCVQPLTSEISGKPCVYYAMRVIRQFEERYVERDQQGRQRTRTRSGSEVVSGNKRQVAFQIDDGTGIIAVDPGGAEFIAEQVVSHFEPERGQYNQPFRLGGFSFDIGGSQFGDGRRTLGYQFEEEIIAVGRQVYVHGAVSDQSGHLQLQKSGEEDSKLLISTRSEAQLLKGINKKMRIFQVAAIVLTLAGTALILFGISQ